MSLKFSQINGYEKGMFSGNRGGELLGKPSKTIYRFHRGGNEDL